MRKLLTTALLISASSMFANDTIFVKEMQVPLLINRTDNILFKVKVDNENKEKNEFNELTLEFDKNVNLKNVESLKLYYSGTEANSNNGKDLYSPVEYISRESIVNGKSANKSYSVLKDSVDVKKRKITLKADQKLFPGINYFWVSLQLKENSKLTDFVSSEIVDVKVDSKSAPIALKSGEKKEVLFAKGVRFAGDDGIAAYRIPGLVTSNKGTLLGVYDNRYNSSVDLQEHVTIGLSRSTDKGQTWEPMKTVLDMDEYGGLPKAQNGVGDPSILVDETNNNIWVIAAWAHGEGNQRSWWNSLQGMNEQETAQLILTCSEDDGKTWSKPINITEQVKLPEQYFLLQGPGRGITMKDGTLVFPIQFIDKDRVPNAGIMFSKDHGKTWKINNAARSNTTEAQVVEVEPGILMLNMRDNRGGSRAVATTNDFGITWNEHPSSRKALQEPVCMASIIKVDAKDNILGKDILIFSNPNSTKNRNNMTIKISEDGGNSWPYELLIDEGYSWGYSCLSMIDKETVGILYEGSSVHMAFQRIPLKNIVNNKK
ncbi:MAG: sialidase family protein [Bacteroidales bacterium]|nr:sialidase family protein [Bacteroidales bacterium]